MIYNPIKKILFEINDKVVYLKTKKPKKGDVLVSYITFPFLAKKKYLDGHTNRWECLEICNLFLENGYNVDVIDWENKKFIPYKRYNVVFDIHNNLERFIEYLSPDCKKIMHLTTAYWKFNNDAEKFRLKELYDRRKVKLQPRRQLEVADSIRHADLITLIGNDWTLKTYSKERKKMNLIPLSTTHLYKKSEKKFDSVRKNFIWLGGAGMVHKGLDMVIEAFSQMPDFNLFIFGNTERESDFYSLYKKELNELQNIKYFGKLSLDDDRFISAVEQSVGFIFPSCSESQSSAVISCMHHGLIPIISVESGIDCKDFGIMLEKNDVNTIKKSVVQISDLPIEDLKKKSDLTWNYARKYHTRETFTLSYREILNKHIFKK